MFVSERNAPFTVSGFAKLVERAGIEAKLPFKCHPYILRHATGYALANRGVDTRTLQGFLGHRSIQSTVRYTELEGSRTSGASPVPNQCENSAKADRRALVPLPPFMTSITAIDSCNTNCAARMTNARLSLVNTQHNV